MLSRCIAAFFWVLKATGQTSLCAAYLILILVFVMMNVLEAPVLSRNGMEWVIFMAIGTRLSLTARGLGRIRPRSARPTRGFSDFAGEGG